LKTNRASNNTNVEAYQSAKNAQKIDTKSIRQFATWIK